MFMIEDVWVDQFDDHPVSGSGELDYGMNKFLQQLENRWQALDDHCQTEKDQGQRKTAEHGEDLSTQSSHGHASQRSISTQ